MKERCFDDLFDNCKECLMSFIFLIMLAFELTMYLLLSDNHINDGTINIKNKITNNEYKCFAVKQETFNNMVGVFCFNREFGTIKISSDPEYLFKLKKELETHKIKDFEIIN